MVGVDGLDSGDDSYQEAHRGPNSENEGTENNTNSNNENGNNSEDEEFEKKLTEDTSERTGDTDFNGKWIFNAIQNITVYNQDKKDITELGGKFRIVEEYKDGDGESIKTRHIDERDAVGQKGHTCDNGHNYENEDGAEVDGFKSKKPFYIVVDRGSMKFSDFKDLYAKITFQYLDSIDGKIYQYVGEPGLYRYERKEIPKTYTYEGSYEVGEGEESRTVEVKENITLNTVAYELMNDNDTGANAQDMFGYVNASGVRNYKTYSVGIKAGAVHDIPEFVLEKVSSNNEEETLYGAKFDVTLIAKGRGLYDEEGEITINKEIELPTLKTGTDGRIIIDSDMIESYGLDLKDFYRNCYIRI